MAKQQLYSIPGLHQAVTQTKAGANATEATATCAIWKAPCDLQIVEISQFFESAITGANTDSRTLSFIDGGPDGTGTSAITGASKAFTAGVNASVLAPVDMSPTTPYKLDEGDILIYSNAKVGSGLSAAVPRSTVQIAFRAV